MATTTAAARGIHLRATNSNRTHVRGRKIAVVIRSTSSVLPKSDAESRSTKNHPAGKGAPSPLRAIHQSPGLDM